MKKTTGFYPRPKVDTSGRAAAGEAGGVLLTSTVRVAGLDAGLSSALAPWRPAGATHDPAKVLLDLALTLALGGDTCSDLAVVRGEPAVFGPVASDPTLSRTIARLAGDVEKVLAAIDRARADARSRVWAAAATHAPDHDADARHPLVVDVDATLVTSHREGERPPDVHLLTELAMDEELFGCSAGSGMATVRCMAEGFAGDRDLSLLIVPRVGMVEVRADLWEPVRLLDPVGDPVVPVAAFLNELQAAGRSAATQRSYAMDLLRWFRFGWGVDVAWDQATRVEARDFCRWLLLREKPRVGAASGGRGLGGAPNPVTGKTGPGRNYAPATRAHSETVLRVFYDFHRDAGTGPMVNPFPLSRDRAGGRANAHHNPMEPFRNDRVGLYRPRVAQRIPRAIPDELFNRLFAELGCHRDRALVAMWVSTAARASELLGVCCGDVDPGQQLITVIRKGTRAIQALPASPDAFVWLRLYQAEIAQECPTGRDDPLWWTRRRPFRALSYPAARAMFTHAGAALGANWTLHDLRHTAAYRMARDPQLPLSDVQWVLGHAHLSTTQLYLTPMPADVVAAMLAHHRRGPGQPPQVGEGPAGVDPSPSGYWPDTLDVLFGGRTS